MEIQSISGADAIPRGTAVESRPPTEAENTQRRIEARQEPAPEENKGANIDTYA